MRTKGALFCVVLIATSLRFSQVQPIKPVYDLIPRVPKYTPPKATMKLSPIHIILTLLGAAFAFVPLHPGHHQRPSRAIMASTDQEGTASTAVQTLLDKAAQIRAEIAALEGKTVEQVQNEANEKKQRESAALEASRKARKEHDVKNPRDYGRMLEVPNSNQDMINQAARAMERAFQDGVTRQTIRLALVKEGQPLTADEQWPGGAEQMYREAAKPLTYDLMRELRLSKDQIRPLNVSDQDIWDFDGSGLVTGQSTEQGPKGDVQALVFANTDVKYTNDINTIDRTMGKDRLFFLVNPFWRDVESWGINILAPGAKKKAKEIIFDKGYDETYVFLRFSCRGEDCVAIKAYPYDWQIFAYIENESNRNWPTTLIRLGSTKEEPKSKYVTELLNALPEFKLSKTMRQLKR